MDFKKILNIILAIAVITLYVVYFITLYNNSIDAPGNLTGTCQYGNITDIKVFSKSYLHGHTLRYYFEIDNNTWIKVNYDNYMRWGAGDNFKYFNSEIVESPPWMGD